MGPFDLVVFLSRGSVLETLVGLMAHLLLCQKALNINPTLKNHLLAAGKFSFFPDFPRAAYWGPTQLIRWQPLWSKNVIPKFRILNDFLYIINSLCLNNTSMHLRSFPVILVIYCICAWMDPLRSFGIMFCLPASRTWLAGNQKLPTASVFWDTVSLRPYRP